MELIGRDLACMRGGREVFSGLSFRVDAGKALLLVGPNGSGKSSLLRLVAGLLRPAAGTIALNGGEAEFGIAEQAHYLGHQDALKPSLSVRENLEFWAEFLGAGAASEAIEHKTRFPSQNPPEHGATTPPPEPGKSAGKNSPGGGQIEGQSLGENRSSDDVGAALGAVGLDELADLPAAYLSAGQRRRLSIARLLAVPRPLWLLDEPTAALDAAAQVRLAELMHAHLTGGGLILAATHGPIGLDAAQELRLGGSG